MVKEYVATFYVSGLSHKSYAKLESKETPVPSRMIVQSRDMMSLDAFKHAAKQCYSAYAYIDGQFMWEIEQGKDVTRAVVTNSNHRCCN